MTDLVLEHLKRIQQSISRLENEVRDLKTNSNMMLRMMGELTVGFATYRQETDDIKSRLDRIERRLDLHDDLPT